MMKRIDPYKHEEKYAKWKSGGSRIPGVTPANEDLIRRFIRDMELGLNVSRGKRGGRSYVRLNTLRNRIGCLARRFTGRCGLDVISDVTEEQAHTLFGEMRSGVIKRYDGKQYIAVGDFIKDFKGFWHWLMVVKRKDGTPIEDVTLYLDTRRDKPRWVYLSEEQVKRLCDEAKYEYRVLMQFLLDSGVRSPSELVNIRVNDFDDDFTKLRIREETSKTFGRRINLLLCPATLGEYVKRKGLDATDIVFPIRPEVANRYLKRLAFRVLGDGVSLAGEKYSKLTLYDFRHVSACYWMPRYKSESALKYRFGWKKTERIHYYTELLGMKDNITEEDLLLNVDKTEVERRLAQTDRDKQVLQERLDAMQCQMEKILEVTDKLSRQVG